MGWFDYISPNSNATKQPGIRTDFSTPVYIQFTQGMVLDVVTSVDSAAYTEDRDINSIIAQSHFGDDITFKQLVKDRYYPLFRGMTDVPAIGDPVLLCEFGGVNYYLGPINTGNNPNYNLDHLNQLNPEMPESTSPNQKVNDRNFTGIGQYFPLVPRKRLQKIYKSNLDDPKDKHIGINENHGDMIFEGRFGNSIRLGSRNLFPNIFISNNINPIDSSESFFDGSLISMTSAGSILNHFSDSGFESIADFDLASNKAQVDDKNKKKRLVAGGHIEENDNKFDREYGETDGKPSQKNQIFINSGKLTFNAYDNNITLSSFHNFDIGVGNSLTINTKKFTSIESSNIYLGKQAQEKKEPIVLGEQLKIILEELVGILESAHALVQGVPVPITDSTAVPLLPKIQSLKSKLATPAFHSQYHYIEENKGEK
jgi:hypothetical protein